MNVNNSNQTYLTNNNDIYPYKVGIPVLCTIAFLSLLLNCTILISAKWIRHKMSPNLRLSVSLAAADALTSALFIVGLIVNSYLPIVCGWPLAYLDCFRLFLETLRLGAVITSVLHLLLLSVNQLIGIVQPLRYRRIISTRVVTVALLGVWLLPTACLNIFFALLSAGGYSAPNCRTEFVVTFSFRICVFLSVLIPFVLVLLIYVLVVVLLKRVSAVITHTCLLWSSMKFCLLRFTAAMLISSYHHHSKWKKMFAQLRQHCWLSALLHSGGFLELCSSYWSARTVCLTFLLSIEPFWCQRLPLSTFS